MNIVVTHVRDEYAQVHLESGERVLISISDDGILISKLWLGFIPVKTVYDRSQKDIARLERALMTILAWNIPGGVLERVLERVLSECRSSADVERMMEDV